MKRICVLAMLLCSLTAAAQQPAFTRDQQKSCMLEAEVFRDAASMRDSGMSPQQAFANLSKIQGAPQQAVKGIINTVYFDNNFAGAGGEALFSQVYASCLNPKGSYQPLK